MSEIDEPTFGAIDEFLEHIPEPLVAEAIGGFLRALISGLNDYVDSCKLLEGVELTVKLFKPLKGTVATRSRVPAEWVLLDTIKISIDKETTNGSKLNISGIQVVPIDGGLRAWKALEPKLEGIESLDDRRAVAWEWWNSEDGRDAFEGTKLWRVVESLAGLGYGALVPTYARASLVLGCALGIHQDLTSLHYRYDPDAGIDVVGTQVPVPATKDKSSPEYNSNEAMKDSICLDLWAETASSPMKRQTAAKFASSSLNYAALFSAREGERGASAASVQKLFTVGRCFGGASVLDYVKGKASAWQYNDETYQMTGNDGRIVWKPLNEQQNENPN